MDDVLHATLGEYSSLFIDAETLDQRAIGEAALIIAFRAYVIAVAYPGTAWADCWKRKRRRCGNRHRGQVSLSPSTVARGSRSCFRGGALAERPGTGTEDVGGRPTSGVDVGEGGPNRFGLVHEHGLGFYVLARPKQLRTSTTAR
jgi:hypothetical protein